MKRNHGQSEGSEDHLVEAVRNRRIVFSPAARHGPGSRLHGPSPVSFRRHTHRHRHELVRSLEGYKKMKGWGVVHNRRSKVLWRYVHPSSPVFGDGILAGH